MVLPFFLGGQAALTFRTNIRGKVKTVKEAFMELRKTFLTEEARRANDAVWESLSFESIARKLNTSSKREILRHLFQEIERLRSCTSVAATASSETIDHITRAKLLPSVSGVPYFVHVRSNPPQEYLRLRSALYDAATQVDTGAISRNLNDDEPIQGTMYTDRRYQRNQNRRKGQNARKSSNTFRYAGNNQVCYVCGNERCHSRKHTPEEREKIKRSVRNFLSNALAPSEEENEEKTESDEDSGGDLSSFSTTLASNSFVLSRGANPSHKNEFFGVTLDTACSHYCKASRVQYLAYCHYTGQKPCVDKIKKSEFNTSGGKIASVGMAKLVILFGNLANTIVLETHIFGDPYTASVLFSYKVMKDNRLNIMILRKRLVSEDKKKNL